MKNKAIKKAEIPELITALKRGNLRKVKTFLARGWNPSDRLQENNPLSFCHTLPMVDLLIQSGADVNKEGYSGTPLLAQIGLGNEKMVDLLIKHGADVNQPSTSKTYSDIPCGTTPLMRVMGYDRPDIVTRLLTAGADVNALDKQGHNALFHALHRKRTKIALKLLKSGSMLQPDVLAGPVYHGDIALIKLLIRMNAEVNCEFRSRGVDKYWPNGDTLLGYAISRVGPDYPMEIVRLLVKAGADVNQPSNWWVIRHVGGKSYGTVEKVPPIRIAGNRGLENIMKMLWKAGATATFQEAMEGCTLERAAFYGDIPLVKLLLKSGANVNEKGPEGNLPLTLARAKGHGKIVTLLKQAGAKD